MRQSKGPIGRSFSGRRETASTADRRWRRPGRPRVRARCGRNRLDRVSPVRWSRRSRHPVSSRRRTRKSSRRSTREPATRAGATPTRPPTATTSGSTRDRGPSPSWRTAGSTRSARKDSCTRSTRQPASASGAWIRCARFGVRKGFFGAAGSPLVEDGRVIANIGGTDGAKGAGIVAFNAETGAVLWTATDHEASYSSPVGATLRREAPRRVLHARRPGGRSIPRRAPSCFNGPWRSRSASSVNAATPLVVGDRDLRVGDVRDRRRSRCA